MAADRMGWSDAAAVPGWRGSAVLVSREAVSGELATRLRFQREPAEGVGGIASWDGLWSEPPRSSGAARAGLVIRRGRVRGAAGGSLEWWETESVTRVWIDVQTELRPGVLIRAAWDGSPGDAESSAAEISLVAAGDGFWGGLRAGPRLGAWSAAVGVTPVPRLALWLEWIDAPALGASFHWAGVEIRARETRHDLLGRVHRLEIVLGAL